MSKLSIYGIKENGLGCAALEGEKPLGYTIIERYDNSIHPNIHMIPLEHLFDFLNEYYNKDTMELDISIKTLPSEILEKLHEL